MPITQFPDIRFAWKSVQSLSSRTYQCAWCGNQVASSHGLSGSNEAKGSQGLAKFISAALYICPQCSRPTYFETSLELGGTAQCSQHPSPPLGTAVQHVPADLLALYEEARHCTTVGAFTAAVLLCRKILLHVAVEQQSPPNINFQQAVDYLATHGIIPRNGRGWVDRIRKLGNEANHEIVLMTREQAQETLTFTGWLLTLTYQLPGSLPPSPPSP